MRVVAMIGALTLPCALAGQAPAPWFGTWKLNLAKSTDNPGSRLFKSQTCRIEPWEEGLKVTYDMVGTRGGIRHLEWSGKFDGRDYPVQGVDYVLTHAYSLVDDRRYKIVVKMDGEVVATTTNVVSPDGKTVTTVTIGKNVQGQDVKTTSVFEKQ